MEVTLDSGDPEEVDGVELLNDVKFLVKEQGKRHAFQMLHALLTTSIGAFQTHR